MRQDGAQRHALDRRRRIALNVRELRRRRRADGWSGCPNSGSHSAIHRKPIAPVTMNAQYQP